MVNNEKDELPEENFSTWGKSNAEENTAGVNPKKSRREYPSYWPVILGLIGTVVLPVILLFPAAIVELHLHPNLVTTVNGVMDSSALQKKITSDFTDNVLCLLGSLILTWLALTLPVFVTGKKYFQGWKNLVKWKFSWKKDLLIALAFTVTMRVIEAIVDTILKQGAHLDPAKLANGGILTASGTKWLWLLGLAASIGAPIAEELFFRGLAFTIISKKLGKFFGIFISSLLFGLAHVQTTVASSIYMFLTTFTIGSVLAFILSKTGRLGSTLLSHGMFNASAVLLSF